MNDTNGTKTRVQAGSDAKPATPTDRAASVKAIRAATDGVIDALSGLEHEDQLRALEAATAVLGLKKKQNATSVRGT